MKILIIGSNGFIGKHCIKYFSKKHYDVWGADIFLTEDEKFILLNRVDTDFAKLFEKHKFDICVNASGSANVGFSFNSPNIDFELNVYNVQKLLIAIKEYNSKCKLVNFSSAAVYGNASTLPINENSTKKPLSPYGVHKLQSEELLKYYHAFFGLKTCSLRVFSAYGEGLKKQLFWDLYKKYKKKLPITLYGTGNESRDFIYIDDLLRGLELVIINANFKGESINLSSGIETTIGEVVKIFYNILNKNVVFNFNGEVRIGDPLNWRADITKISSFGFTPKVEIKEGLKEYINWVKGLE